MGFYCVFSRDRHFLISITVVLIVEIYVPIQTFLRIDALKKHINSYHKNVKSFTCGICKRSFKGHLTQHLQTHEQHKIYACTICNATFAQNSQLKVHSRVHSGERPFRCMVGSIRSPTFRVDSFQNHFLGVHEVLWPF